METIDRCYDYSELNDELLEKFSEGSKNLEDLLKYCYQNKIITRACCIGHDNKINQENPYPYIAFVVSEEDKATLEHVFNQTLKQGEFSDNMFASISKENENTLCAIYFKYNQEDLRENFFEIIKTSLSNYIDKDIRQTGDFDNIFDAYERLNADKNIEELEVNTKEIRGIKQEEGFFKFVNGVPEETTKEEAEFTAPISDTAFTIERKNIASFISQELEEIQNNTM